jgi:hypothetical protein
MNLRHSVSILSLALAFAVPVVAHADTIYDISGIFDNGYTLSGTYTMSAASVITGADLTINGISFTDVVGSTAPILDVTTYTNAAVHSASDSHDNLELNILGSNTVCTAQIYTCTFFGGPQDTSVFLTPDSQLMLISGSATAETAATPEPSSLMLLGTGFLGLVGVMRKKMK